MENSNQLMKFRIENNKLIMEISIDDLVKLVNEDPENFDGDKAILKIKEDKKDELAKYIIEHLVDDNRDNENLTNWAIPFQSVFDNLYIDIHKDFCEYLEED